MGVSLCLIVKNEGKRIRRCLDSFSSLADEIIIADTGSKDGTKGRARQLGAQVFDFKWKNDFSKARNFVISKARQEWIMMVDADDTIEAESIKKIKRAIKGAHNDTQIIALPYVYSSTGGRRGQTAWLPKLWRNNLKLKYSFPVHEILDTSKVDAKHWIRVDAPILHKKEVADISKSLSRNIAIMLPYIKEKPHDLRMLYYLAHDHRHLGEFKKAIRWCERYLESGPKDLVRIGKVLTLEGVCHSHLKDDLKAQAAFLMAIGARPGLVEPYLELGDLYWRGKRHEEAIHLYRCAEICEIPKGSPYFFNRAAYEYFAIRKLAFALSDMGRKREALAYAKRTLVYTPHDKELIRLIGQLTESK